MVLTSYICPDKVKANCRTQRQPAIHSIINEIDEPEEAKFF